MEKRADPRKIITGPEVRWAYVNAWSPKMSVDGKLRFSLRMIVRKDDEYTVKRIQRAVIAAYEMDKRKLRGDDRLTPELWEINSCVKDGDTDYVGAEYENCWVINCNSFHAPGIVDADKKQITEHSQVYSGVYGRVSCNFYAYNTDGARGIACHLNNLQKIRDGEHLGHKTSAYEDFEEV